MNQPTETQKIIYSMITENTGRHLLDSGGAYGRHWERNSKRTIQDFISDNPVTIKASVYQFHDGTENLEFDVTKSLFHHLSNNLDYEPYIDKLWLTWDRLHADLSYSESMKLFWEVIAKHSDDNKTHKNYCPDDFMTDDFYNGYTYNDENILSQDFVFYVMGDYVFIQTHNGCDARGGFSQPRLFRLWDSENYLFDYGRYTISCENGHYWDFESAGYYEEYTETDIELNKAEFMEVESIQDIKAVCQVVPELQGELLPEVKPRKSYNPTGKILVCDGRAYCPVCGAELDVYTFDS